MSLKDLFRDHEHHQVIFMSYSRYLAVVIRFHALSSFKLNCS